MKLLWDQVGERLYETGVDRGVLYLPTNGVYDDAHAWNGLTTVTESPSGAESNKQYADNIVYLNLVSIEQFGATIEAFTYPEAFGLCDGTYEAVAGVSLGQQNRRAFGFAYRTLVGDDEQGTDRGYKIHLVYGALAAPSEKAYGTVNESPEAVPFSWEISTTPVEVPGINPVTGKPYKPTATLVIDSTKVAAANLEALEDILYGTAGADARLPLPAEVLGLFGGALIEVETAAPTYDPGTDIITIPNVVGVQYQVEGEDVPPGAFGPITEDTVVTAVPEAGYRFDPASDNDWTIRFS